MVGLHIDMEAQIHILEQEAYSAVLRAFKAQSDAISWVCPLSSFCLEMVSINYTVKCHEQRIWLV